MHPDVCNQRTTGSYRHILRFLKSFFQIFSRRHLIGLPVAVLLVLSACGESPTENPDPTPEQPVVESPPASPSPSPSPIPTATPALDTADAVARELIAAEQAIRSAETDPALLPRLGRIQQAAYRAAVSNPEFKQAVLTAAPADLRDNLEANIRAGEELRQLTKPGTKLPDWTIVEPAPAEELRRYYGEAEAEFGIPWAYLASIHLIETRMGRIRGNSSAGAQGPMQFMPPTWAAYGEGDINNTRDAIFGAGRYLKASGAPGNMGKALFAYNRSQRYVDAITLYAEQMLEDERAFNGYYHWQVYYRLPDRDVLLEAGVPIPQQ